MIAQPKRLPLTLTKEERRELLAVPKTRYPTGKADQTHHTSLNTNTPVF